MSTTNNLTATFEAIFSPEHLEKQKNLNETGSKFVHYTSADAALKIFDSKVFWMRDTGTMNDTSELKHGLECLTKFYNGPAGQGLKNEMDLIHPGTCKLVEAAFNSIVSKIQSDTYISSYSAHLPGELKYGKLSMWRAYGRGADGVAIVLNLEPFFLATDQLKSYSTPVSYLGDHEFGKILSSRAQTFSQNSALLKTLAQKDFVNRILSFFYLSVLSTKHKGFEEENEWRVIYNPSLNPSSIIYPDVASINGVPQIVQKIPLTKISEEIDLSIPKVLHKVIIGPTNYKSVQMKALKFALEKLGISNPEDYIQVSDIPLRV